jgi:protein gp37
MNDTAIRWTEHTWNPVSGCTPISPGCKFCYARTLAENKRGTPAFPNGFDITFRPHKLREPLKLKAPSLIFVNSTSDLFHVDISDAYRDQVVDVIEKTPQHQYQVLTKRADNLLRYSRRRPLPRNFWAGVTAEDQTRADARLADLILVEVPIRFVSIEPALGPVDLRPWVEQQDNAPGGPGLQWIIWGGESGSHLMDPAVRAARGCAVRDELGRWSPNPVAAAWADEVRTVCDANDVPFFFKQWGGARPGSAGHELDGRRYEEFPRVAGFEAVTTAHVSQLATRA